MASTPSFDNHGIKKGAWSEEEDNKLRAYVEKYGHWNWRQLPKYAGLKRCGKSCRLRWMNYLRPGVKRGNYSKEEDELIIQSHDQLGNKWSAIAAKLPGRSDNEIKNHWHTNLKTRSKQKSSTSEMIIPHTESRQNLVIEPVQDIGNFTSKSKKPIELALDNASAEAQFQSTDFVLLSPEQSHSGFCSPESDCTFWSAGNWVSEDSGTSAESVGDSGNFWTEPFLVDSGNMSNVSHVPSVVPGLWYPHSPIVTDAEFLCSYGLYDDFVNW